MLTSEYPAARHTPGGIGFAIRTLAHALADLGHQPIVLLTTEARDYAGCDDPIPLLGIDRGWPRKSPFPSTLQMPRFRRRVAEMVQELKLEILEAPEYGGLTAGLNRLRIPIVVRLHTCSAIIREINVQSTDVTRRVWHAPMEWRERRAIISASAVTSISQATAERTRKLLRIARNDLVVIPNAVDSSFYDPGWKLPLEPLVVFAGRLEWRKGPDRLARAIPAILASCPNARFRFVGADTPTAPGRTSMLKFLRTLIPASDLTRVEFPGQIPQSSMPALYSGASVCVFPSRWEGFGLVVAEAMACGAPVIVSDAPAFQELVSNGVSGVVVPADDVAALAAAVTNVLRDPASAANLGRNARTAAMRFHPRTVAESSAELYRRAIFQFAAQSDKSL